MRGKLAFGSELALQDRKQSMSQSGQGGIANFSRVKLKLDLVYAGAGIPEAFHCTPGVATHIGVDFVTPEILGPGDLQPRGIGMQLPNRCHIGKRGRITGMEPTQLIEKERAVFDSSCHRRVVSKRVKGERGYQRDSSVRRLETDDPACGRARIDRE